MLSAPKTAVTFPTPRQALPSQSSCMYNSQLSLPYLLEVHYNTAGLSVKVVDFCEQWDMRLNDGDLIRDLMDDVL